MLVVAAAVGPYRRSARSKRSRVSISGEKDMVFIPRHLDCGHEQPLPFPVEAARWLGEQQGPPWPEAALVEAQERLRHLAAVMGLLEDGDDRPRAA